MMLSKLLHAFLKKSRERTLSVTPDNETAAPLSAQDRVSEIDYLLISGSIQDAIDKSYEYLQYHPPTPTLLSNLGYALLSRGELGPAEDEFRAALALNDGCSPAWYMLGALEQDKGNLLAAEEKYRRAIHLDPQNKQYWDSLLCLLNYIPSYSPAEVIAEHVKWNRHFFTDTRTQWQNDRSKWPRKLRIGYMSADFYAHSTYYFITGAIKARNKNITEIFCYDNRGQPDWATDAIRGMVDHWRVVSQMDDASLARLISEDGIDILVDLAGHTLGNRLEVFAKKPAPIQVTWLGYPQTTGLAAIDYRLTDSILDPPGLQHGVEKPWRMPKSAVCFSPKLEAPKMRSSHRNGTVLFGSINHFMKVNDRVLHAWSRILAELPMARLRIYAKHGDNQIFRNEATARIRKAGIMEDRLELVAWRDVDAFYTELNEIDIILDPFPYNGGTTTNICLFAGLPVITMKGDSPISRCGAMILSSIGREEWIGNSEEEYIRIAIRLANELEDSINSRHSVSESYRKSAICDTDGFARDLDRAYCEMWEVFLNTADKPLKGSAP